MIRDTIFIECFQVLLLNSYEFDVDKKEFVDNNMTSFAEALAEVLGEDKEKISFTYNRKIFWAELDCECDFVIIHSLHDIFIDKDDGDKLTRLRNAVNEINKICGVNTIYEEYEEEGYFFVISSATIFFISENPNFESEFNMTLQSCLTARDLLKRLMKRIHNKRDRLDG